MMNQPVLLSPAILYLYINELDTHRHLNIKLSHSGINTNSQLLVVLQTLSGRILVGTDLSRGIHGFTVREIVSWTVHHMGLPSCLTTYGHLAPVYGLTKRVCITNTGPGVEFLLQIRLPQGSENGKMHPGSTDSGAHVDKKNTLSPQGMRKALCAIGAPGQLPAVDLLVTDNTWDKTGSNWRL